MKQKKILGASRVSSFEGLADQRGKAELRRVELLGTPGDDFDDDVLLAGTGEIGWLVPLIEIVKRRRAKRLAAAVKLTVLAWRAEYAREDISLGRGAGNRVDVGVLGTENGEEGSDNGVGGRGLGSSIKRILR